MNGEWAHTEFLMVDLGDKRLNDRLIKLSEDFIESPESPINQSCKDWASTKAAYRFFQNESVDYKEITRSHSEATLNRCREYPAILAIQDTTYFTYSHHEKTVGLCVLSKHTGKHKKDIYTMGLIMHSTLAVSLDGLPLGIVDQKIYSRPEETEDRKELRRRTHNNTLPIEEKDSYRWIESLQNTATAFQHLSTKPITVCDRESDIFDFFHLAEELNTEVLVRANHNRKVNKSTPNSEVTGEELWPYMKKKRIKGFIEIKIPAQNKQPERIAKCSVRFGRFTVTPSRNSPKRNELSKISLNAVYVSEKSCPKNASPIDWMLLTNIPVETLDQAIEKITWYCLRWRIEVLHKVLKSGLNVEDCRLQTADRLVRYLSVMSIVAWRISWLTLVARISPNASCLILFDEEEWKILYLMFNKNKKLPRYPPTLKQCVRWIAMCGGFLARKKDGEPGNTHVWRGLKKFSSILEGAALAQGIYG